MAKQAGKAPANPVSYPGMVGKVVLVTGGSSGPGLRPPGRAGHHRQPQGVAR